VKDIITLTGMAIDNPWASTAAAAQSSAQASGAGSSQPLATESIEDVKNVERMAEKVGFHVGTNVINKESKTKLTIEEMSEVKVKMQTFESTLVVTVDYKTLLEEYKVNKGKLCAEAPGCSVDSASPMVSMDWAIAAVKGAVALAMQTKLVQDEKSAFELTTPYENPICLKAAADIAKGELRLVCASQRVDRKESSGCIKVGTFTVGDMTTPMYVSQQLVLPLNKNGEEVENPWLSHFWCVEKSPKASECNVALIWEEVAVLQHIVLVPILTNKRKINKGETLTRMKVVGTSVPPSKKARMV
jgi:hypothetical protein